MTGPFTRLAIVNRGEPAMRVLHAVSELNHHRDEPIRTIALYTEPDRGAMFVRRADEAVLVGPARPGYLDLERLERALVAARADAAWVGWGFVAEDPAFVELCDRLGIVFVGPSAATMRALGDKINAKRLAEASGVPVAPWTGPVATAEEALDRAAAVGFPLMVKAAAGGGGRGIRRVEAAHELAAAFASARAEAVDAFGDGRLLLERALHPARHIEVQVIADGQGTAWAVGVRDCSAQRRHQKVVEESASPALDAAQEQQLSEAAERLCLATDYRGAATVEFLYQEAERAFSFMEVNARLQVEHPVTEAVTGIDLVKLQLHVAAGGRLTGERPAAAGHAIEARLCAEDPALGFLPTPGRIALLRLPTGPGIRVDRGVAQGDAIPAEFDSMIAKLIAWGPTRDEALARLRRAVAETTVVVEDGTTNQGFLRAMLDRPELLAGTIDTTWIDRVQLDGGIASDEHAAFALAQAAIEVADTVIAADRARFFALARRGRPHADLGTARPVELRHGGHAYRVDVRQVAPDRYRLTSDGVTVEAAVERHGAYERRLRLGDEIRRLIVSGQGDDLLVEVDGVPHRVLRDDGGVVRSLAPAVVVALPVAEGEAVHAGDVVAVVESMKMETSLVAPVSGRVRRVLVTPNVQVAAHQPLVQLDPAPDGAAGEPAAAGDRIVLPDGAAPAGDLAVAERLLLGFDVEATEAMAAVRAAHGGPVTEALLAAEERLLTIYADLSALTRSRTEEDEEEPGELPRGPQEHLNAWLRDLDAGREGLPASFVGALERALAHYGVTSLERRPALEAACHRVQLAHQRTAAAREVVLAVLDHRIEQHLCRTAGDLRAVLDRLVGAAAGRDLVLADLARELRRQCFDEPLLARARDELLAAMDVHLMALTAGVTDDPGRAGRIASLVACPQPLASRLTARLTEVAPAARPVLLEVMTRRYYRIRKLSPLEPVDLGAGTALAASYDRDGVPRHLVAAFLDLDELGTAAAAVGRLAAAGDEAWVADFYVPGVPGGPEGDALAERLQDELAGLGLPPTLERIVVAVAVHGRGAGMAGIEIVTLRRDADGAYVEDRLLRGLHPLMSQRLHLWRLRHFDLERLPSAEDVYLFHGTGRSNPKDERLFALAEVRDLTPVRDAAGRVTALPELERMLVEALEGIRAFQAHRTQSRRLLWNRVLMHVWPVNELSMEEVRALVGRLAPGTTGLGIEMILLRGPVREPDGTTRDRLLRFFVPAGGHGVVVEVDDPPTEPLQPLDEAARHIVAARRRGTLHPAELVKLLAPAHHEAGVDQPAGAFVEHDLDETGRLVPVDRPPAMNEAGIVCGVIRTFTDRYPEGMTRVAILGDPTKALGALAEPECRRINAALDLAEAMGVPVEWFAISAGAKIAMDSGTENMDWIAAVLRRIIEFTQAGGEINVVVCGINVGAQPYWNAEATMLMHTKGILVMTPAGAMVLTGKQSLDFSGGVSADDNQGIGGYDRIMGVNGQAQYWAPDLPGACRILLAHYEYAYVAPGERFPRRGVTTDPADRDVQSAPHHATGSTLATVGEIFSDEHNPDRKRPFDIRCVMRATVDADCEPLERWADMRDSDTAVVWDAFLGGRPVLMLGFQGLTTDRHGEVPADGPSQWTSGTLFPRASKKVARAINAASGRRPVVALANLAGFDGSPESMREWQLEFGAEIGRAVVNFDGPIVFCVVSRYHGGAFVVFSQALNEQLEAIAVRGAKASVIGGAPAAAVVFARDVARAAASDPRITALDEAVAAAGPAERAALRAERQRRYAEIHSEKLGETAARFDAVHSVERAVEMGSVRRIIEPEAVRPLLIEAVERGISRILEEGRDDPAGLVDPVAR